MVELLEKIVALQTKRDRIAAMFDEQLKLLRAELEAQMRAAHAVEINGRHGEKAVLRKAQDVKIKDFLGFFEWVAAKKAWDVLTKRVAPAAVLARLQTGEKVPDIEVVETETLVIKKGVRDAAASE